MRDFYSRNKYMKEADVEISAFLKYINTRTPTDDFTKELSYLVEEAKLNNIFRDKYLTMNIHDQDIKKEAYEEGLSIGLQQGAIETAQNMLSKNISLEIICECTNLSREIVENLLKETKQHILG